MSFEENSPLVFGIALLMAAVLKLKMLLGFISDSLFCTPSSDSLFRENTNEEDWNCLPSGALRAGSRELLGEAESASSMRKLRTSAEQWCWFWG